MNISNSFLFFFYSDKMTDMRTLSSSTTNSVTNTNSASTLPTDLNNVSGLTTYVSCTKSYFMIFYSFNN
jgi:hypothetical protein